MHTLVRFPLRQGENVLNAVASRDKGTTQMGFTLRAFATAGTTLEMTRVSLNLSFSETVSASTNWLTTGDRLSHQTLRGGTSGIRYAPSESAVPPDCRISQ